MPVRLSAAYFSLALELQEAAPGLSNSHVQQALSDAVSKAHKDGYAYYQDHIGDQESGDVIYRNNGQTYSCPYEMSAGDADTAPSARIDTDQKTKVRPVVTYLDDNTDDADADGYAKMAEAWKRDKIYGDVIPLFERFVSKDERDSMSGEDFAGKGKSYPINKPEDVSAAASSIGRAGSGNYSTAKLKANIIAIAKRKGWTKYLPKAWQDGGDNKESAGKGKPSPLKITEAAAFAAELDIREATAAADGIRTHYPIKLISPGTGSTAHYTKEALQKSAKLFKAGTLMYWNHPTRAEEAARPEGDLDKLAAITTKPAKWLDDGPKGPGLYAEAKVMADYGQKIQERAPHIGLSIRGGGTTTGATVDGKPVLDALDYVESVDYVTRAGRGGVALAEAARDAGLLPAAEPATDPTQEGGMGLSAEESQLLKEALGASKSLVLEKRRRDAIAEGARLLAGISLPPAMKQLVIENAIERGVPEKDGNFDAAAFKLVVESEAKRVGQAFGHATGSGDVFGMGTPTEPALTADQIKAQEAADKASETEFARSMQILMPGAPKEAIEAAIRGREEVFI